MTSFHPTYRYAAIPLFVGCIWFTSSAYAQTQISHRVSKGDTLELLAAEYYGDRRHAVFILAANNIPRRRVLKPGRVLRIPMGLTITVNFGDSLMNIAERHMGDKRRAPFLAEYNDLEPDDSLPVGEEINVPFHILHRVTSKQTLEDIASLYLGDPKHASLLQEYNFLDSNPPNKRTMIAVPVPHVQVRTARRPPPDPESKTRRTKRRKMQAAARKILPEAKNAWREGNYAALKRDLTKLDMDYLSTKRAIAVGILLGGAYIAFGDQDSALAIFRRVIERAPKHALSTYDYSPTIRNIWEQAGGSVANPI